MSSLIAFLSTISSSIMPVSLGLISPKVLPCERFGFLAIFDKTSQLANFKPTVFSINHIYTNRTVPILVYCERHGIYYLILCSEMSLCSYGIIEENQNSLIQILSPRWISGWFFKNCMSMAVLIEFAES